MKHPFTSIILFLFILLGTLTASGQGTIQGKISDAKTGESIIGASVYIQGTTIGSSTDIEGKYLIKNVNPGTYNIIVSFVSYKTDTIREVRVRKDKATELSHAISEDTRQLSEVSVTARRKTDSEISVINASKQSNLIIVGISSQQISKSQDKDASEVIKRLPGVTIMDNRFVVVRGLIERYNTVWLNNASTPSSETDQRAFSFDIIPSNIINNMVIYKTPAPEIPSDFAGAFIQIATKNTPDKNSLSFSYAAGYNDQTTVKSFQKYKGSTTDWLGFDNGTRALPSDVPATKEMLQLQDYNSGTAEERTVKKAQMTELSRSFSTTSSTNAITAPLDNRFNIDLTHLFRVGKVKIGTISSLAYRLAYNTAEIYRSKVENYGTTTTGVTYSKVYNDERYEQTNGFGVISNWSLLAGKNVFEFNNMYNQRGISTSIIRTGVDHYRDDNHVYKTMLGYASRSIYSGSLNGTHPVNDNTTITWTAGYAYAHQDEPDNRLINYYAPKKNDSVYYPFQLEYSFTPNADANARIFSEITENNIDMNINLQQRFAFGKFEPELKAGFVGLLRDRNFYVRPFGIVWAKPGMVNQDILHQPIDSVYYEGNFNFDNGVVYNEVYDAGYKYKINQNVYAGYLGLKIPVGKFITIYGGIRVEKYHMDLLGPDTAFNFVSQTTRDTINVFPSVNITFSINPKNLIRLAYGKTVNRPEYREISPFAFYNFRENVLVYGNPDLQTCYIQNYDLRYEWYPSTGEMVTIGAFYKSFINPIEATWTPSSGGEWDLHYLNAIDATSIGFEVDIRKGFQNWRNRHDFLRYLSNFQVILNAAYIRSRVTSNPEYLFVLDHNRPMFGQSPYIVNVGLYYQTMNNDLSISFLYNVFGQRIIGVGTPDTPNSYEMPRIVLDFTIMKKIGDHLAIKFGVKDILNQEILIQQTMQTEGLPDAIIKVKSYYPGRLFAMGINYTL